MLSFGPVPVLKMSTALCTITNNTNVTMHYELTPVSCVCTTPTTDVASPFVFFKAVGWLLPHSSQSVECVFYPPFSASYSQFFALKSNGTSQGVMRVNGVGFSNDMF